MRSWRESILNDFVPNVSKLTLVADPDSLLTEETLALELRSRGFELIEFDISMWLVADEQVKFQVIFCSALLVWHTVRQRICNSMNFKT